MSKNDVNAYRWTLFHVTKVENANSIIESQKFRVGDGLYGEGVYFANTIEACKLKVKHHLKDDPNYFKSLTFLVADVYVGKAKPISKSQAQTTKPDRQKLLKDKYTAIIGYELPTGREIICLDPTRIHNIKYALGRRPNISPIIKRNRIALFFVTSKQIADKIHRDQKFIKTNGKYGKGIYLYMSIGDALDNHPKSETYLACEAKLDRFYQLKPGETLSSPNATRKQYDSFFTPADGGTRFYIFKNKSQIFNIHYCGGKPW